MSGPGLRDKAQSALRRQAGSGHNGKVESRIDEYRLERATLAELPAIMRLEGAGFPSGIVEEEEVFRSRMEIFPEGFLILREGARGGVVGYLCAERWDSHPGLDPGAYRLGHDPAPRHRAEGTVLYVASMTVDPLRRGAGLGATLFRDALSRIEAELPAIATELLIVDESWVGARRIYDRTGFRTLGIFPAFFAPLGLPPRGAVLMERQRPTCAPPPPGSPSSGSDIR